MSLLDAETSTTRPASPLATTAGWYDDPMAQHRLRYFDGRSWTDHVTHYGPTPCAGCG